MSRFAQSQLSPQHTGSTVFSSATRVSSMSSYPGSAIADDTGAMRSPWRSQQAATSPRNGKNGYVQNPMQAQNSSNGALAAARIAGGQVHAKIHKRRGSQSGTGSSTPVNLTAFPTFDSNYGSLYEPAPIRQDNLRSPDSKTSKIKIKPLLKRLGSDEKQPKLDLSRSAAENEGLGIYTSVNVDSGRDRGRSETSYGSYSNNRSGFHTRTASGASQISTSSGHNQRKPTTYVHPVRQTPEPYAPLQAPTIHSHHNSYASSSTSVSRPAQNNSNYSSTHSSYIAPNPLNNRPTPPQSLHVRTNPNSITNRPLPPPPTPNAPGTPSSLRYAEHYGLPEAVAPPIPGAPPTSMPFPSLSLSSSTPVHGTARSSIESKTSTPFRLRSRTNTADLNDPAIQMATVAALRAEFNAKEKLKEQKWAAKEAKARAKRELSEQRSAQKEAAGGKRSRSGTVNTMGTAGTGMSKGSRHGSGSNIATEPKILGYVPNTATAAAAPDGVGVGGVPLGAIGYDDTQAYTFPYDEDLEALRRGVADKRSKSAGKADGAKERPLRTRAATVGSATKGVGSTWSLWAFKLKTVWLRMKRSMGMGGGN